MVAARARETVITGLVVFVEDPGIDGGGFVGTGPSPVLLGGRGRGRTCNPQLRRLVLYPLSYAPVRRS